MPPVHEGLACEDVVELSGAYVLHALSPEDEAAVRAHLSTCPQAHAEVSELGAVSVALAELFQPEAAPAELRPRVLAAIAAEVANAEVANGERAQDAVPARTPRPAGSPPVLPAPAMTGMPGAAPWSGRSWLQWGMAAAAVLIIAALGAWNLTLVGRANEAEQRARAVAQAIAASADASASVAVLRGTGSAVTASGFAAFPAEGSGYILLVDLPQAPQGMTWQAWHLLDGAAISAGVLSVGGDGYALLSGVAPLAGTDQIALTLEPAGGVEQPTSTPVVVGDLSA